MTTVYTSTQIQPRNTLSRSLQATVSKTLSSSSSQFRQGRRFGQLWLVLVLITLVLWPTTAAFADVDEDHLSCDPEFMLNFPMPKFFGVWQESTVVGPETLKIFDSWADFQTHHHQADASLIDVETSVKQGVRRYAGLWRTGPAGYEISMDFGAAAFNATRVAKEASGLGMTDLELLVHSDGSFHLLSVWKPGAAATDVLFASSKEDFIGQFEGNYFTHMLIDFETWESNTGRRFVGVYRLKDPTDGFQELVLSQNWCDFHIKYHDFSNDYRLEDQEFYDRDQRLYGGIFTETDGDDHLWIGYQETGEHGFVDVHSQMLFSDTRIRLGDFDIEGDGTFEGDETRSSEDGPVINSSPVLHDTGSLGPD